MWRPGSEAQGCSDLAAFVEWLRATRGDDGWDPDRVTRWHNDDPKGFAAALRTFGGDAITAETLFAGWAAATRPF